MGSKSKKSADRSGATKLKRKEYEAELSGLEGELVGR